MNAIEFNRPGRKTSAPRPVYAVVGDDAYLRRESVRSIVREASGTDADQVEAARFNGDQAALVDVLDELRTLPFFSGHRVAIVESADSFVTANRKALEAYVEHPSSTGSLVLVLKSFPSNTKLAKLVANLGQIVECKAPAEAELSGWIERFARESCDAAMDRDAAMLLVELAGPEVGVLASEVEKLAVSVGERRRIGVDDVRRMVGAGRVETIWRVLDCASTGRGAEALDLMDRLLTSGEYPAGLLAAMSTSLRRVHHAGQLRRERRSLNDACREAGVPTFPRAIEMVQKQHAHLGPARVDALPTWLLETDLNLKGFSQLPPRLVIERLLVRLAQPRED
jgi:DNA polymerase-3 subunit delta